MKLRKIISVCLIAAMLLSMLPAVFAADDCGWSDYTDHSNAWYHDAVDYVIKEGFMSSIDASALVFGAAKTVTRAQMVQILWSMEKKPEAKSEKLPFTDVLSGKWYYNAAAWAYGEGLTAGTSPTTFEPDRAVDRSSMAQFLKTYAAYKGQTKEVSAELSAFVDEAAVPSWARGAMEWAVGLGVISGSKDGNSLYLNAKKSCSRAEMAQMLMSFHKIKWEGDVENPELLRDMVAGWRLNQGGTSSTVFAEASTKKNGVNTWGVWLKNETFGFAMDFSTAGSNVLVKDSEVHLTESFAISAWIYAPVRDRADRVIVSGGTAGQSGGWQLFLNGEKQALAFRADGMTVEGDSGMGLADANWHHVLVSCAGGRLTYYIDAKAIKTVSATGSCTTEGTDLLIGADTEAACGFDGSVTQVRIYNKEKTPREVTDTVLVASDNEAKAPTLELQHGIVFDRRQYLQAEPLTHEGQTVTENDLINCMNMGFDHVKVLLTPNHLMDENGHLLTEKMAYISQIVEYVEKNHFKCIVCVHPEDDFKETFLGDLNKFELLCCWYEELAWYIGENWNHETVAIQLMTEPYGNVSDVSWSWMSDRMWGAVRNVLPEFTILTSSDDRGNIEHLKLMTPATDNNLIYTFTTYAPYTIGWYYYETTYGKMTAWSYVHDIPYPVEEGVDYTDAIEYAIDQVPEELKADIRRQLWGYVNGEFDGYWESNKNQYDSLYNANWHMLRAKSLDDWNQKYGGNIHIMCVEFGCMDAETPAALWASAAPCFGIAPEKRVQFIKDMREAFDAYGIGWDYWSYNEAHTIFTADQHEFGFSPDPVHAVNMFDYDMLIQGLGLTPLVSPSAEVGGEPNMPEELALFDPERYDGLGGWHGTAFTLESLEGKKALAERCLAGETAVFCNDFMPKNFTVYKEGTVHIWLYVEDTSQILGGQIELSSSNRPDLNETSWELKGTVTKNGWNELVLRIPTANQVEGGADFAKINYIRIYMTMNKACHVGLGAISLVKENEDDTRILLFDGTTATGFWGNQSAETQAMSTVVYDGESGVGGTFIGQENPVISFSWAPTDVNDLVRSGRAYIEFRMYISEPTKITGGQFELGSNVSSDIEELSWNYADFAPSKGGWTTVRLYFDEAALEGSAIRYSEVQRIRFYVFRTGDVDIALSDCFLCYEKGNAGSDITYLFDGTTANGFWGSQELNAAAYDGRSGVGSAFEGVEDAVICYAWAPANLSSLLLAGDGFIEFKLYVSDPSKITGGQFELGSAVNSDIEELAWDYLTFAPEKNGWTTVRLYFADATIEGSTINYSNVQRIRFYLFRTGGVDIALSECYFGSEKRTVDMSYEEAVEQAYTRALLFTGSDNMKGSIAAVLQKAQNGEKITVAMLGDSITAGAGAGVGRAWVDQVGNWLEKLDGDESNRNVTVINAGIGSTEAVLGVSRIAKDVLAYTPDLVIVDFGTNDYGLLYGAEAYEGILTKLICAGIPVINSNVCPRNGNTIQSQQIPINANYGVPQVSFREAYYELSRVTDIVGLRANDIWTSDHVHPSTAGHTLLANLLIKYMQREIFDKHIAPAALDTTLPTPITKNGFKDAELIENDSENDHICVTMDDGWTADYQAEFFQFQANGWQTSTVGATITFTVSAGYFYLMNSMTANAGTVELKVDGKRLQSLNCNVSDRYMNVFHVFHFAEPGEHTVTVTTVDNPNVENDWFGICSVGIANFDGYNEDTDSTKTVLFDGTNSTGMWGDGEIAVQTVDNVVAVSRTSVGKATPAEPYDVIFCGILGPINASALAEQDEAYVNLRIYISDVSKVLDGTTAGVLELSSEGSLFDGVVLWSQIVNRSFVNGWNTVQLKLSEATKTGTTAFDASKINLFRFYIRTTGDIKVALADCYISNGAAEGPVYPTTLFNGADTTGMWGDGTITVETIADTTGIFRDSVGAASQTVPYDVIFCGLLPAVNASKNAANEDAYVNLKIYISDVSKVLKGMTGGVLEISSEGSLTDGVLVWYEIVDDSFVNGWNTVKLKLNTASTAGDIPFDASKINLFRFYIRTTGDVKIGLADCLVTFE